MWYWFNQAFILVVLIALIGAVTWLMVECLCLVVGWVNRHWKIVVGVVVAYLIALEIYERRYLRK